MNEATAMRPGSRGISWRGEILGALNATAAALPFVITYAFIAFGALGDAAAQVGLTASVIALVIGGAAMAALGVSRLPTAGPSASACLIVAGAVLSLTGDPALDVHSPRGIALLLATLGLVVVASGVLTVLLGVVRAGSLVRFVPQPVLAGLMNGVAVLIVLSQLAPMLGLRHGALAHAAFLDAWTSWQGAALVAALATAALMAFAMRRSPRAPAPLMALVVAGFAVWLWQSHAAPGSDVAALHRIGPLTATLPRPDALGPLFDPAAWPLLIAHAPTLALTAVLLAGVGALESMLNLATVQALLDDRSDPNHELIAVGAANVLSGLFGGLPLVFQRLRSLAIISAGGRSRVSVAIGCVLLALVFALGLPLIEAMSTAVVAGVVVMLAWQLVDQWSRRLVERWWAGDRSGDLRKSLLITALVASVMVGWNYAAGVGLGVIVSMIVFVRTLNRQLVRTRYTAADFPSRRSYTDADEAALAPLRPRIAVIELEGALFFGSADRLVQEADRVDPAASDVVVDLRRISTIDATGALALVQLGRRLARRGVPLLLAGVRRDDRHGEALLAHGVPLATDATSVDGAALRSFADVDRAIEAAERHALDRAAPGHASRRVELAACHLLDGLSAAQFATLAPHLHERRLGAGERLFAQGAPGRALYVITEGAISVVEQTRGQRFATLSPGMCLGETAVLDGGGRTADAVAEVPSVVHELSKASFDALQRSDPEIAAQLYRNLSRHLSQRLRAASTGWRKAAD